MPFLPDEPGYSFCRRCQLVEGVGRGLAVSTGCICGGGVPWGGVRRGPIICRMRASGS